MIKSIQIKNLFGLYSYDLTIKDGPEDDIRFITGPNGYGKTTLLKLLEYIYTQDLNRLIEIPFDDITIKYESGEQLIVTQKKTFEEDDNIDESLLIDSTLNFKFLRGDTLIEEDTWNLPAKKNDIQMPNLKPFLYSFPLYYIKDDRLRHKVNDYTVDYNASLLQKELQSLNVLMTQSLWKSNDASFQTISAEEYDCKFKEILPLFNELVDDGFEIEGTVTSNYQELNDKSIKMFPLLYEFLIQHKSFINRLAVFKKIVLDLCFADKDFHINKEYGYRFVMRDDVKTILLGENLSSGEQHLLILIYDLLFNAQDDSLVLIDEPELSFHLAWQSDFLMNVRKITRLRKLQLILCTHSVAIFDHDFSITQDLYDLRRTRE